MAKILEQRVTHHDSSHRRGEPCNHCVDDDERETRRLGLIATAGLIRADREEKRIAALISQLPAALDELERIANDTRRGGELAAYKTALDDVRAAIAINLSEGIAHLD